MKFLNQKTTWTNLQLIPLKLCIAAAYLIVGMYFHEIIHSFQIPVIIVFILTLIYTLYLWITKIKNEN